jgi:predicted transcriptional regulator
MTNKRLSTTFIGVHLPQELGDRLRRYCESTDRVMGRVITRALTEYLDKEGVES